MLILPITFEDLDGNTKTENFHFNLTRAEIAELELSKFDKNTQGLQDHLTKIVEARNGAEIVKAIKAIIEMTIGRREGDLFIKNEEITRQFIYSGAYSSLFMRMTEDPDYTADFVKGVVPSSMSGEVKKKFDERDAGVKAVTLFNETAVEDNRPAWIRENRPPTQRELREMTKEQLVEVMQRDAAKGGVSYESKESTS